MLVQHPDLDGIYVTWAEPADGVLSALRSSGNTKTKIVTLDLAEPVALDMVKDGNVVRACRRQGLRARSRHGALCGMKALQGQQTPSLHRRSGPHGDQGECSAGLEGFAQSRRPAVRARRRQVAAPDARRRCAAGAADFKG